MFKKRSDQLSVLVAHLPDLTVNKTFLMKMFRDLVGPSGSTTANAATSMAAAKQKASLHYFSLFNLRR